MRILLFALFLIGITYLLKQLSRNRQLNKLVQKNSSRQNIKKINEFMENFECLEIGKYRDELLDLSTHDFAYALKNLPKDQREQLKKWSEELLLQYNLLLDRYCTFVIDERVLPWEIDDVVLAFKIAFLYYYLQDRVTGSLKKSFLFLGRFQKIRSPEIKLLFPIDTPLMRDKLANLENLDFETLEETINNSDEETISVLAFFVDKINKTTSTLKQQIGQYEEELFEVLKQAIIEKAGTRPNNE
ncbi:hypothetical protein KAJ27_14340 [bacterium]|nr:hypothetical protein [bacterium]